MKRQERVFIGVLGVLALGAACLDRVSLMDAQERLERLPAFGPGYTMQPLSVSAAEQAVFGKATIFRRLVSMGKQRFVLTVIDGTANRHALHDPIYCIRGAGYEVVTSQQVALPEGPIQRLTLSRKGKVRELLYYFSDGKVHYTSPLVCWREGIVRRLTLGSSGPAAVLIELEPLEPGLDPARVFSQIPALRSL